MSAGVTAGGRRWRMPGPVVARYLLGELIRPFAVTLAVLVALFASFNVARFLSDAVNGLLPDDAVVRLTGLKVLISLEVLIPISLYIAVLSTFGRLHAQSELDAMFALRMRPRTLLAPVLALSCGLATVVGALSLVVRPWAYSRLHALADNASVLLDAGAIEAGSFYLGGNGRRVIYVTRRDGPDTPGREVFFERPWRDGTEIVSARLAFPLAGSPSSGPASVYLRDAWIYQIAGTPQGASHVIHADGLTVDTAGRPVPASPDASPVAATSRALLGSRLAPEIAELQWRLSNPVSTVLLGLLAVALSGARRRQGRQGALAIAFAVYFAYYLICISARTWVQYGTVPALPGLWWAPALLAVLVALEMRRLGRPIASRP